MPRRTLILPSLMLTVLLGFSLTGWAAGLRSDAAVSTTRSRGLVLSGSVKGLYPGATAKLRVSVRNRLALRLRVTRIAVTAGDANRSCRRGNLTFGHFRGRLSVPAHRRRFVNLEVTMARAAPEACKNATFRLSLRGVGGKP
jgi:hypothetical protein